MPDISKLLELAQILGVDVQELLGSEKETAIVNKIIDQSEDIKLDEVAEVVELMKPSQVEEAVEKASDEEYQLETRLSEIRNDLARSEREIDQILYQNAARLLKLEDK